MLIKTVTTVVSTDSVGRPVDSIPVRTAEVGETDAAGYPVAPVSVTEDAQGVPVRFVVGKAAQNSAGQWVDTVPVQVGELPAGFTVSTNNGVIFTYSGAPVFDNSPSTPFSVRTAA